VRLRRSNPPTLSGCGSDPADALDASTTHVPDDELRAVGEEEAAAPVLVQAGVPESLGGRAYRTVRDATPHRITRPPNLSIDGPAETTESVAGDADR
jgi:hypothetical protein